MSALCKSGCLGCENCDPTGERRERNDRNTSYFIGVHQSLDVLVRERDTAIAYAAQVEARLRAVEAERDDIAFRVEHPELAHLHYDACPYKPFADTSDWDLPENPPACTCGYAAKGAYWKGQHMLERGYHQLTREKLAKSEADAQRLTAELDACERAMLALHESTRRLTAELDACEREARKAERLAIGQWLLEHGCSCAEGRKYNVPRGQCPHELAEALEALVITDDLRARARAQAEEGRP